ncbi:MAG: TraB/GumN family protein [Lewinellaceae bacterium]|nr:TraB/GumN family protein [Lewinellaceae bacterium]
MTGLLWEISGNGISKPGYLYGTMHVSEKLVFNLSDTFFIALRNVDMVALETDHDEWQEFTDDLSNDGGDDVFSFRNPYNFYGGGGKYQNLYNESFLFNVPDNELLSAMLSSKPVMSNEFLYRSNMYRQEYEEDTYLDLFIFQAGKKLGKKVIGLETLEGSYEAAFRAQIPDDEDKKGGNNYRGYFDPSKMEEAYRNQDLSLLDSLNKLSSPGKNFQRWMLDERNVIMANRIDSILRSGTALFSAVGAAHLPGETGVITLLRNKGFHMRPVRFTTAAGNQDKDAIEKIHFPAKLARQWSKDSLWSAEAPGKFYPTADYKGFEQHLCADMNNGAFYAVYRLKTYGWWSGQTPEYISERIDSLLYEQIPGKIQERVRLKEPFPGHQITTRTRRGDVQRYKIFVTPYEVIMFTTGGNGDYALGEEAERFLGSIRFSGNISGVKREPTTLAPAQGGFRVTFPATLFVNTTEDKKAENFLAATVDPVDSAAYFLYRVNYHDWNFIEEDTFELNIIGEKVAEQFTKQTPRMQLLSETPYPTQDISFQSDHDSAHYFARLVINGPHYYLIGCRKKTNEAPAKFFDSFSILPPAYPEGWKETNDTTLDFRVTIHPIPEKARRAFLEKLKEIVEEGNRKRYRMYDNEEGYDWGKNGARTLKSTLTGEEVSVRSWEYFSGGAAPTRDSFELGVKKTLTRNNKLALRKSQWEQRDSMIIGDFLLQDTNSTRGIKAKVILINKRMYTLLATVNLKAPESAFIQSVFNTFDPTDSIAGPVKFGERSIAYLLDIYAADSLKRKAAISELKKSWNFEFKPEDFSTLKRTVEHPDFDKLKFLERTILINAIGETASPEAVLWLRDFCLRSLDSARYQSLAMNALAKIKTRESFRTLFDLWQSRPVYFGPDQGNNIFSEFRDTLELTVKFFPNLLELADVNNNRESVFGLLNTLVKKGLIKAKSYARLKPGLIRETAWYLSQNQYEEEQLRAKNENGYAYNEYYDGYRMENAENIIKRNFELLSPFVLKDEQVKNLLDRGIKYGDKSIQLLAYDLYLRNGLPVDQAKLKPFIEDDKTRYTFFCNLVKAKKLRDYNAWFADTVALAKSYVMEGWQPGAADSIRFISRHKTVLDNKPATLYFFDIKGKDDKDWGWHLLPCPTISVLSQRKTTWKPITKQTLMNTTEDTAGARSNNLCWNLPVKKKRNLSEKKSGKPGLPTANGISAKEWTAGIITTGIKTAQ